MKEKKTLGFVLAFVVSSITFMVYLPALGNGFVNWDDNLYVYENKHITSFGTELFRLAFLDYYAGNWHPLTLLSHAADYALWGLTPGGHHLTNNILHAVNTFLVVLLAMRLIETALSKPLLLGKDSRSSGEAGSLPDDPGRHASVPSSFLRFQLISASSAGLLFGLHPIHVESVAWVSERKDVLCAFFFLLSIMAYIRFVTAPLPSLKENGVSSRENGKRRRIGNFFAKARGVSPSVLCFFVLALLSKPMAVTLPVVLLILDWFPLGRIKSAKEFREVFAEKFLLFVVSLASVVITIIAQSSLQSIVPLEYTPLWARLLVSGKALASYLGKMVFPVHLVPLYPYPNLGDISFLSPHYFFPILTAAGIATVCIIIGRMLRILPAAFGYYLVTLLPVLGIIQVGGQAMADRYAYLPSLGPGIACGCGIAWLYERAYAAKKWRSLLLAGIAGVLCLLAVVMTYRTIVQIGIWRDDLVFWDYVIEKEPEAVFAYYNRGLAYGRKGFISEATDDFSKAITLSPKFDMAYNNRGAAFFLANRFDMAFRDFTKAIELNQGNAEAYINRGYVSIKAGDYVLARTDLQKGCDLGNQKGCEAIRNLGGQPLSRTR